MEAKHKTAFLEAITRAISILHNANEQTATMNEKDAHIEAIQYDLLEIAIKIINRPKTEQIIQFLKTVKYHWHIPDSLIKQLSVKFNCDFETLKFLIQFYSHSQQYHNYNHEENI